MKHMSKNSKQEEELAFSIYLPNLKRLVIYFMFIVLCVPNLLAQSGTIKGKVTDASKEPVIGVAVQVDGTTNGTITDIDGNYSINREFIF